MKDFKNFWFSGMCLVWGFIGVLYILVLVSSPQPPCPKSYYQGEVLGTTVCLKMGS
jgi:hypothetical protein